MFDFLCAAEPCVPALQLGRVAICALFAILFLQSGLDKVFNWKSELGWITEHFANTPFKSNVPAMLAVITLFEVASGAASAVAGVMLLLGANAAEDVALLALVLCAASLLQLFFGQRIAKDYPGAGSLVPYFIVALLGFTALG